MTPGVARDKFQLPAITALRMNAHGMVRFTMGLPRGFMPVGDRIAEDSVHMAARRDAGAVV